MISKILRARPCDFLGGFAAGTATAPAAMPSPVAATSKSRRFIRVLGVSMFRFESRQTGDVFIAAADESTYVLFRFRDRHGPGIGCHHKSRETLGVHFKQSAGGDVAPEFLGDRALPLVEYC